jgi:hypothetical protein
MRTQIANNQAGIVTAAAEVSVVRVLFILSYIALLRRALAY